MNNLHLNPRDVQSAIRKLEVLDPKGASIADFESHLTPLLRGYKVVAPMIPAGLDIYRARKCEKPIRLADLSYPPAETVTALGRANDIGEPIFYGATARAVPFFELDAQPGDYIALSKWRTIGPMMLNHIGFSSEPESFKDAKRQLDSIYKFVKDTRAIGDLNALVHDYLAYSFSRPFKEKDTDRYKLTIAISRKLLSSDFIDGLLYPTIQMSGNADNIALKTDAVDRLLNFVNVKYFAVKSVRGKEMDIDTLDSATRADLIGVLMWTGRNLQWKLRPGELVKLVVEQGEFVAYDALGNRVDPE